MTPSYGSSPIASPLTPTLSRREREVAEPTLRVAMSG